MIGPNKPGTIGIRYPGNAIRVVDLTDPTREMPVGERGERMFRGPLVMLGYYGNAAGTAATIEPDGWLHTGDVSTMHEDGYFTIVDRIKDMILTAGFNVHPGRDQALPVRTPRRRTRGSRRNPGRGERRARQRLRRPQARDRRHARRARHHSRNISRPTRSPRDPVHDTAPDNLIPARSCRLLTDIDDGTRTTASDLSPAAT